MATPNRIYTAALGLVFLMALGAMDHDCFGQVQTLPGPPKSMAKVGPSSETLAPLLIWRPHTEKVYTICFDAQGQRGASASGDKTVKVWDVATGKVALTLKGHTQEVFSVAFSPDGKRLVSTCAETKTKGKSTKPGEVKVWDAGSGKEIFSLSGHTGHVYRAVFSPDGTQIVTAAEDRTIEVWDAATGKELRTLQGHAAPVYDVVFSPNGKRFASAAGNFFQAKVPGEVKLWDASTGKEIRTFTGHEGPVYRVRFSPDGRRLATASGDNTVKVWDVITGKELLTLVGHTGSVYNVAFHPDGRSLASAGSDSAIRVWNLAMPRLSLPVQSDHKTVYCVVFSPDGKRLFSTGEDKTVKVWDVSKLCGGCPERPVLLTAQEFEPLWTDLAGIDRARAYRALWTLAAAPGSAVPFLRTQLRPRVEVNPRITRLLLDLDHDRFAVRENASVELEKLGRTVEGALRQVLEDPPSPEVHRRVERLLDNLKPIQSDERETVRVLRVVLVLEQLGTAAARTELEALARGVWGKRAATEARKALDRLANRQLGGQPALGNPLDD